MTDGPGRSATTPHTIALVTPNFNTAPFLSETIESVLQQGYPRLEYVIADGGSTDGSLEIIEPHREQLHALLSGPDAGHADAINRGFARTSGELMGWINSDDLLHDGALSTVDAIFSAFPEVEWITGIPTGASGGGGNGPTRIKIGTGRSFTYGDFLAGDYKWLQQESTFWRRSLWDRVGGELDTDLRLAVDFELWMRFFRHARPFTVEALLGAFRHREGQRSAVFSNDYFDEVDVVIAREREAVQFGAVAVPQEQLKRSTSIVGRSRIVRRLRSTRFEPDISRAQVDAARMSRWSERIGSGESPFSAS